MGLSRKKIDEYFMRRAISLAFRGTGRTSPNPMVGCVVVRDGRVLAEGFHSCCGEDHAERAALGRIADAAGTDLYVNLEPCSHFGRTPPCAPLIVERGVSRVVVGMTDPDERVRGRGLDILRAAGVAVEAGVLGEECRWINRGFIRRVTLGRPWVTVKGAVSLDGAWPSKAVKAGGLPARMPGRQPIGRVGARCCPRGGRHCGCRRSGTDSTAYLRRVADENSIGFRALHFFRSETLRSGNDGVRVGGCSRRAKDCRRGLPEWM